MRSLRGRITAATVPDNPYRAFLDPLADDAEDDESLRTHRSPAAAGLSGWGWCAVDRGWLSREERAAAIASVAARRCPS